VYGVGFEANAAFFVRFFEGEFSPAEEVTHHTNVVSVGFNVVV
tara:strand:+ start:5722 stop:5850 length:129 start_codon:yes stop_codon:yes gene_type:complete